MKNGSITSHQKQNNNQNNELKRENELQRRQRPFHLLKGKTFDDEFYANLLQRLSEEINQKRPHLAKKKVLLELKEVFFQKFCFLDQIQHVTLDEDPDINTMSSSQLSSSTETSAFNLTSSIPIISVEILRVVLPPGIGNAVKLIWGRKLYDLNLNVTYGVHYGKNDDELKVPKLLTTNESVLIENLDFCTQYSFAVSVGDEYKINLNNIRSVVTYLDRKAPPQNLQVEFEPQNPPCLFIKWSASCANIGQTIGYVISLFDHETTHYTIITLPPSNRVDFSHPFQTYYGAKFDIKVSTNFPGSEATKIVTYKVPNFLEPYKVKISTNLEAGAFMLYWKEPYVPSFIDRLYYEVYIYKSLNTSDVFEKYYVTRPVLIYKGDEPQYMFRVGSVSYDGQYRSVLTDPLVADVYGEVHEVEID